MRTKATTQRVAANVRAELAVRQIKASALAAALGITTSTMHRRLNAESAWPVDDLERIAGYLGVSVEALLVDRDAA